MMVGAGCARLGEPKLVRVSNPKFGKATFKSLIAARAGGIHTMANGKCSSQSVIIYGIVLARLYWHKT